MEMGKTTTSRFPNPNKRNHNRYKRSSLGSESNQLSAPQSTHRMDMSYQYYDQLPYERPSLEELPWHYNRRIKFKYKVLTEQEVQQRQKSLSNRTSTRFVPMTS